MANGGQVRGVARKGKAPLPGVQGCTLGSPGGSLQSEGLQSLRGLRVGGVSISTAISTPGLGERLPQLDQ